MFVYIYTNTYIDLAFFYTSILMVFQQLVYPTNWIIYQVYLDKLIV